MKKKLAIVTTHPIQYQVPLFKKLTSNGIEVDVFFASKHGIKSTFKDKGFNKKFNWDLELLRGYNHFFSNGLSKDVDDWKLYFKNLETFLKKKNYNALLFFGWSNLLYLNALYIAKKLKIKTILRVETNLNSKISFFRKFLKFFILKILFRKVDYFLYIGKLNKKFYKSFKIKNSRLLSAPYFVDNDFFQNKNIKKKNKKTNFLFVGKLINRKNPLLFLKIAESFRNNKNIYFNVVGSGPLYKTCKKFIIKKNLNNVSLLGFKNQKELKKIYSLNDYLVLTSNYETWGLVVNEAMANGLPVITSLKCGSAYDLIDDKCTGFIYKNSNHLLKIISMLSKNKKFKKKLKTNVLNKIKHFNVDKTVMSINKILYKS